MTTSKQPSPSGHRGLKKPWVPKAFKNKSVFSWALYDWANSAYATTVMAAFFPIFFKEYWSLGVSASESTFRLGLGNSAYSLVLALSAPFIGAMADLGHKKKIFLLLLASLGALATGGLYFVGKGQWEWAIALYMLASLGFAGGNVFYDALIVFVSSPKNVDSVSGYGYGLGYLGGGILLAVNVLMYLQPQLFGLSDGVIAIRLAFVTVAVWWALFSIPLFLNVKEPHMTAEDNYRKLFSQSIKRLISTFHAIRKQRVIFYFLFAYFFYIDGVNTMIKMAVDYGLALGFQSKDFIAALIIIQFIGFPAAIMFGFLGQKIGTKAGIFIGLGVYVFITTWGYFLQTITEFYFLAACIGLVQGGVQSLSRSYYSRLIPPERSGEYFGFFNTLGKFAAVLGPFLMGVVSMKTGSPRDSILAILLLFIIGGILFYFHDKKPSTQS